MDKLRTALVGIGGRGRTLTNAFAGHPEVEIVAVCDVNADACNDVASEFDAASYDDFSRLFAEEQCDLAMICLPHHLYPDAVCAALESGAHVLKEKPFARDLADAEIMCAVAKKTGRILMIGGQNKFAQGFQRMKSVQASGELGDVFMITGRITYRWTNALHDKWSWRGNRSLSGGVAIIDSGWHPLDLMHWYKGLPKRIHAATGHMKAAPGTTYDVDDKAVINLEYTDGAVGSLVVCFVTLPAETRITLHGTKGSIDAQRTTVRYYEDGELRDEVQGGDADPTTAMVQHFVECVRSGTEPTSGAEESLEVQRMVEAAYASAESGQAVTLDA